MDINNLSEKIEKIGKFVINCSQELRESLDNSTRELKDSLNKAETVLKLEGIKAGLATATPQDQKQMLGEKLLMDVLKKKYNLFLICFQVSVSISYTIKDLNQTWTFLFPPALLYKKGLLINRLQFRSSVIT